MVSDDEHDGGQVIDLRQVAAGAIRANREDGATGRSQVDRLLALVADRGVQLFRDQDRAEWALVPIGGHTEPVPISERGTSGFTRWLYRTYHDETGQVPGSKAVSAAVAHCLSQADLAPVRQVWTRVAELGGVTYIDLCRPDHQVAACTPDGWSIAPCPDGVCFRRSSAMREIVGPDPDGTFAPLCALLAPRMGDDDQLLFIAWLVGAWQAGRPYPVLQVVGEQGTGKSTLCRLARMYADPYGDDLRAMSRQPKDEEALAAVAVSRHVSGFDNISYLPDWLSDALAALSTGAGWAARKLYTNHEIAEIYCRRPVVMNGIADIATRADLLDRSLIVTLSVIPEEARLTETEFWSRAEAIRSQVAGAMLNAVCAALRDRETTEGPWPRMADFAQWVQAAEPALPWPPGRFREVYAAARRSNVETALDASPLVPLLTDLVRDHRAWSGTATELLDLLCTMADPAAMRSKKWPQDATRLSGELTRLAPALRAAGIADVRMERKHGKRKVLIGVPLDPNASGTPAAPSGTQRHPSGTRFAGLDSQNSVPGAAGAAVSPISTTPQDPTKQEGVADIGQTAAPAAPDPQRLPYKDPDDDPWEAWAREDREDGGAADADD